MRSLWWGGGELQDDITIYVSAVIWAGDWVRGECEIMWNKAAGRGRYDQPVCHRAPLETDLAFLWLKLNDASGMSWRLRDCN